MGKVDNNNNLGNGCNNITRIHGLKYTYIVLKYTYYSIFDFSTYKYHWGVRPPPRLDRSYIMVPSIS